MDFPIILLLVIFMAGMLFMSSRARKKQQNQQDTLQNSLAVGDVVVMTSGISGTVVDLEDERTLDLEIAPDVVTTWLRVAVREKLVATDAVDAIDDVDTTGTVDATDTPDAIGSPAETVEPAPARVDGATTTGTTTGTTTAPGSRDDDAAPSLRKTGS